MRTLILLSLVFLALGSWACEESADDPAKSPAKGPASIPPEARALMKRPNPADANDPLLALACKASRTQLTKVAQLYSLRFKRYPSSIDQLRRSGHVEKVVTCPCKGKFEITDRGIVTCTVHGR